MISSQLNPGLTWLGLTKEGAALLVPTNAAMCSVPQRQPSLTPLSPPHFRLTPLPQNVRSLTCCQ